MAELVPPRRDEVESGLLLKYKKMEGFVYILQSLKNSKYYIGSTNDLDRRIMEHSNGSGGKFTKMNGSWKLISYKRFGDVSLARIEEKKIKSYKGGCL